MQSTTARPRSARTAIAVASALALTATTFSVGADDDDGDARFRRIATFPVFLNTDADPEKAIENVSNAEIVAVSEDGMTLIYTDSEQGALGFVDISDPENPEPSGLLKLGEDPDGLCRSRITDDEDVVCEPTSVAVSGPYAIAAVNTSQSFVDPSGHAVVVDIDSQSIVREIELAGQPDAVATSDDGLYAAIAIENERDEDLPLPQLPAGLLQILDLVDDVDDWSVRDVALTGLAEVFPTDPEPEYVDINEDNIAVVTLQENNHLVVVDLFTGEVESDFSAGTLDLTHIDVVENRLIEQTGTQDGRRLEPDGVSWIDAHTFATADEGDLVGGSRSATVFDAAGETLVTTGSSLERLVTRIGHYPEERSENKGNEPENVEVGAYRSGDYLFVGSERSSVVFVYRIRGGDDDGEDDHDRGDGDKDSDKDYDNGDDEDRPRLSLVQVLPAGVGPEGLLAIGDRGLLVAASEVDERGDKFRSSLNIYRLGEKSSYPTIVSRDEKGKPIPWGALSDAAVDPFRGRTAYTVYDSFYRKSRIFDVDITRKPALIERQTMLSDRHGVLAAQSTPDCGSGGTPFTELDGELFNPADGDDSVNLDPEGISLRGHRWRGFWIGSEGAGNLVDGVSDPDNRPFESPNLLLRVSRRGTIQEVVQLPASVACNQLRFGFEGVAAVGRGEGEKVFVAFQREWTNAGDPEGHVRLGRYHVADDEWTFAYYPLEEPSSPNGGWTGLSAITHLGGDRFAVIERDNQGGPDARIKRIYAFGIRGVEFKPQDDEADAQAFDTVEKQLVRDLIPDLKAGGGAVLEKVESLAVLPHGRALIVTDNDGVDDASGETLWKILYGVF